MQLHQWPHALFHPANGARRLKTIHLDHRLTDSERVAIGFEYSQNFSVVSIFENWQIPFSLNFVFKKMLLHPKNATSLFLSFGKLERLNSALFFIKNSLEYSANSTNIQDLLIDL